MTDLEKFGKNLKRRGAAKKKQAVKKNGQGNGHKAKPFSVKPATRKVTAEGLEVPWETKSSRPATKGTRKRKRKHLSNSMMDASGIPKKFWDVELDKVDSCLYRRTVERYIEQLELMIDRGKGLWLWGPNRRGKTALAVLVLQEALRQSMDVHFIRAVELVDATFNRNTMYGEDVPLIDMVRGAELVVVDDLGKVTSKSGAVEGVFDDFLRFREAELTATIVTTNSKPSELDKVLKPSTIALVEECMYAQKVDGHDWSAVEKEWMQQHLGA